MLSFDPDGHRYTLDGRPVPSVTRVLAPLNDFEHIPPAVLQAAADRGTNVHLAAALLCRDALDWDSLDEELTPYLRGLARFLDESGAVVIDSERRVASAKYGYAGTLDATLHWRGGMALADWKATASVPLSVGPQTAAYCQALSEETGQLIKRRYCIQLLPDSYKVHPLKNPSDWALFMSCLNIWRAKHG